MANRIPISGAVAGAIGSPYVAKVQVVGQAIGNYTVNNTNYPGLLAYIPGWVLVIASIAANLTMSVSPDNGVTWIPLSGTGGGWIYVDSGITVRINIANGVTTVNLFAMGG